MTTCVGTNENSGSRPHREANAQAAASESKSQFVVVSTTLQGSADAATGSAGAAAARAAVAEPRAALAGQHLGLDARKPPAVCVTASSAAATRRRLLGLMLCVSYCSLLRARAIALCPLASALHTASWARRAQHLPARALVQRDTTAKNKRNCSEIRRSASLELWVVTLLSLA